MASPADNHEADQEWLRDRADAFLARIDAATPALYRRPVPVPAAVQSWADGQTTTGLAIVGLMGRGKTHLAWQAARQWVSSRVAQPGIPSVITYRATELFDKLRPDAPTNPYTVLEQAKTVGLFILDDVAAAKPTVWTQERLYELIDERYTEQRPLLITADVPPKKLDQWVGPRVASRLTEMCSVQVLDGPDHRAAVAR